MKSIKLINSFFRTATKAEVEGVYSQIVLTERQEKIFQMFYIKKHDIGYIADMLNVCPRVIGNELSLIRKKLQMILPCTFSS